MKFFKYLLALLRWIATKIDELIFGRSYKNYVGAGTVLDMPFYSAAISGLIATIMHISGHSFKHLAPTALAMEACICCICIAMHYKHYFNMPTVPLKIGYFIYLTALCSIAGFFFTVMFIYIFVIIAIILFVVFLIFVFACSGTREIRKKYWWEA